MKIAAVLMMFLLFAAGCHARVLYIDPSLVGTWHWTGNVGWTYVFYADGTGQRGDTELHRFTWGTDAGLLVLEHGAGYVDDEFSFNLSGNILQLEGEFGILTYFRFVPDENLAASWVNTEYLIEKQKKPDGTGLFLAFIESERRSFYWFNAADMLIHKIDGQQEEWTYSVTDYWLLLESRIYAGLTQEWRRGSFTEYTRLLGEWYWSENDAYRFSFSEESFATQNLDGVIVPLYWTTFGDMLFLIHPLTSMTEHWRFDIADGELHLESLTREGARYRYRRVAEE